MKPKKQIKVYFCPKCKSMNVKHFFAFKNLFGVLPKWRCGDCGFECQVLPMMVVNENKLKEIENGNK